MTVEKADEIMAEYLLKGGKMLSKTCRECGFPLFEYKGDTRCVICPERAGEGEAADEAADEVVRIPLPPQRESVPAAPPAEHRYESLAGELERTLIDLCARARTEPRADECLVLMKAVLQGTRALSSLRHR